MITYDNSWFGAVHQILTIRSEDWVVQNGDPHYGIMEHASVDTNHGYILATTMTPTSVHNFNSS